jgi:tetratricopeptide (TPR) repeat protein
MPWITFPYPDGAYLHSAASLEQAWPQLHRGDAEPFPLKARIVDAWIAFHAGDFERARRMGLDAGLDGYAVAHKATCIYASFIETSEKNKLAMFEEVAERCERQKTERPLEPAGFYWYAFGFGRYAQGISIVKALAQGAAPKVRASLERAIVLAPTHAEARTALGVFHTEIVASVGAMIGNLTYGVKREEAIKAFRHALVLEPESAIARIEYARGLLKLEGKKACPEAHALFLEAAAIVPHDAMTRLHQALAQELASSLTLPATQPFAPPPSRSA